MTFTFALPFPSLLLIVFLLMLFMTIICSSVLVYHWRTYGENKSVTVRAIVLYLLGIVISFSGMSVAIMMTL